MSLVDRMSSRKSFEADVLNQLAELREQVAAKNTQPINAGRFAAIYGTTPHPRIDGQITIADCLESVTMQIVFMASGLVAGAGSVAIGGDLGVFPKVFGGFSILGAFVASSRLIVDATLPRISELWQFITVYRNGDWQDFQNYLTVQQLGVEKQEIVHTAEIKIADGRTSYHLGLKGDDLARAVTFAREYLALNESSTSEDIWIKGKLWPGSRNQFLSWRDWCIDKGLAWVTDQRGKWEFKHRGKGVLAELAEMDLDGKA